jgi:SAM-dependent methyltransferase
MPESGESGKISADEVSRNLSRAQGVPGPHFGTVSEGMRNRSWIQKIIDFVAFPFRAMLLHDGVDRWGLTSLASERYLYVCRHVRGYCLDVGCGPYNRLVTQFLSGGGKGIDVYPYPGLTQENVVLDISSFPFADASFASVTFVANFNHVPKPLRERELAESLRVLEPGGNIIITMGRPWVEILVHNLVALYDRWLGTKLDIDSERGMSEEEDYYVARQEIMKRLLSVGFRNIERRFFWTQWALNQLFVGWKPLCR